ncbi:hypothetical protein R1sor_012225 [Riccia sorocarpa]|uniref:SMP domain-containing protein n=1 Tax=Riccia sorocarpa TaxID=122646 RepID=A0ABD3I9D2_9MARC
MRPRAMGDVDLTAGDPGAASLTAAQVTSTGETIFTVTTVPALATTDQVTIGEVPMDPLTSIVDALETAGARLADKPLEESDARAIQSAEARATGVPGGLKGGPAAMAQSVVDTAGTGGTVVTVGDVLLGATMQLPSDKPVTTEDASRVQSAEARHTPTGEIPRGGVASTMQQAAAANEGAGGGA